jgi:hypothetical protein
VDKLLGDANRAIFVGDFTQTGKTAGETENMFPEGYPLAAVRKAYGEIDLSFNAEEQIPDIIDRLTAVVTEWIDRQLSTASR